MKKRRRKRKSKLAKIKLVPIETQTVQRGKFPKKLVSTFIDVSSSDWEDNTAYKKYIKEAKKYLGNQIDDRLECGRLIVQLAKATMELVNVKKKKEKKKD